MLQKKRNIYAYILDEFAIWITGFKLKKKKFNNIFKVESDFLQLLNTCAVHCALELKVDEKKLSFT